MKVAILLATYNGEKYLRAQLDSLYAQSYRDWTLYVNDDGSTDGTLTILQEYAQCYGNIDLQVNENSLRSLRNFMDLLRRAEADYYIFSDQDDVWMPEKVEKSIRRMQEVEHDKPSSPVVVFSDLRVVDESLQELSPSFWHVSRINPTLLQSFNYLAVHFLATGCTMTINQEAKRISFPFDDTALMHDSWIVMQTAYHHGVLSPIYEPLVLYRQHATNVLGAEDMRKNYILHRLTQFKRTWRQNCEVYRRNKNFNWGSVPKYCWYKIMYFLKEKYYSRKGIF